MIALALLVALWLTVALLLLVGEEEPPGPGSSSWGSE